MSGRWWYAIVAGLLLGAFAAWAGFKATAPIYESTGMIHIAPKVVPIMRETPETALTPNYAGFVQMQATLVTSDRVVQRAAGALDPEISPWPTPEQAVPGIRSQLTATVDDSQQLIIVRYRSSSPHLAQAIVSAVIRAYDETYGAAEMHEINRKLHTLRGMRRALEGNLRQKRSQQQDVVANSAYAVADLQALMNTKATTIQEYEAEIRRLERVVAEGSREGNAPIVLDGLEPDMRELEALDPELARLSQLRDTARLDFELARQRYQPRHRGFVEARRTFELLDREYREREAHVLDQFLTGGQLMSLAVAEQRLVHLRREVESERAILSDMSRASQTLAELHSEIVFIDRALADNYARIRELEIESEAVRSARVGIQSYGDRPIEPVRDRRYALAVLGALGGLGGSFGMFFLLGTVDRRLYAVHQMSTATGGARLLGVLPALPFDDRGAMSADSCAVAAHCVHQIRNQIESARASHNSVVLAVSSPYQGDGKTSLALALGASYAASGCRTVLLDCDMVGRRLSHHLKMEGGYGLHEALVAGDVTGYVRPLDCDNLSALPAGNSASFGPEQLRRDDLDRILAQLRSDFDVIIIDTGPLFGCVESIPVVTASDGVVLVVRRGRRQGRLHDCIDELQRIHGHCIGVVLNHANTTDCNRYVSSSHTSAVTRAFDIDGVIGTPNGGPGGRTSGNGSRNALLTAVQLSGAPKDNGRSNGSVKRAQGGSAL